MQENQDIKVIMEQVKEEAMKFSLLTKELEKIVVGQKYMIDRLLIGVLTNGHILLEGAPGLAKTLAVRTLSEAVDGSFSRIQFTPDLLPADIVGTMMYNINTNEFSVKKGPVFANFVLADEINRSPAKVQASLLEAMQEKQVTIGDETFKLPSPFLVLATQNPIEQEGTYNLPEAQLDRFMLKCTITYPEIEDERKVLRMSMSEEKVVLNKVLSLSDIERARKLVESIYMDEKIENYILDIVYATRFPEKKGFDTLKNMITYGASPRATISMAKAAKAHAFLNERGFITPEDVKAVVYDVLRHRIGLSYEAELEGMTSESVITEIISKINTP